MGVSEELLKKNKRALAKAITAIENENEQVANIMNEILNKCGKAKIIGITGFPGVGKSTLVNTLANTVRKTGAKVGIIAVDPSSPFSGGAILGDRIRMDDLIMGEGIFIRSMGTRGTLGGLSAKTADVVKLYDAFGFDIILIETVGVGQSELDIMKLADTVVLVMVPGLGDDIQIIKSGIIEIADIFVINKADHAGVDKLEKEIESLLYFMFDNIKWYPPICKTISSVSEGISELYEKINEHYNYLVENKLLIYKRNKRANEELQGQIIKKILEEIKTNVDNVEWEKIVFDLASYKFSVKQAADKLIDKYFKNK